MGDSLATSTQGILPLMTESDGPTIWVPETGGTKQTAFMQLPAVPVTALQQKLHEIGVIGKWFKQGNNWEFPP